MDTKVRHCVLQISFLELQNVAIFFRVSVFVAHIGYPVAFQPENHHFMFLLLLRILPIFTFVPTITCDAIENAN